MPQEAKNVGWRKEIIIFGARHSILKAVSIQAVQAMTLPRPLQSFVDHKQRWGMKGCEQCETVPSSLPSGRAQDLNLTIVSSDMVSYIIFLGNGKILIRFSVIARVDK